MPVRISQLLDPAFISLSLRGTEHAAALDEVSRLLQSHPDVTNYAGFYEGLLARDRLDTTCLGNGIALPHARTEYVRKIVVAVGRSDQGVTFAGEPEPVRLLFVLGTPKAKPGDYLALVGTLCRLIKDSAHRALLLSATTPEDFITTVAQLENKVLGPEKMPPPAG